MDEWLDGSGMTMTISLWTSCHAPFSWGWRRNWSGYVWVQRYCLLIGPCFGACIIWLYLVVDLKKGEESIQSKQENCFGNLQILKSFKSKAFIEKS